MATRDVYYHQISGSLLNVGTSEETTIQLPVAGARTWLLKSAHFDVTGGSAATYVFELGAAATWTAADIDEIVANASVVVATTTFDVYTAPIPFRSDANGRIYLRPGFNTGADNDADYHLFLELVQGGSS